MPATSARGLARLLNQVILGDTLLGGALSDIRGYCIILVDAEREQLGDAYDRFDQACEVFRQDCCDTKARDAVLSTARQLQEAFLAIPDITLQRDTA
ncbi:MAG: hypothetical protein ABIP74_00645 [Candidatus Saccharimonas sp.]